MSRYLSSQSITHVISTLFHVKNINPLCLFGQSTISKWRMPLAKFSHERITKIKSINGKPNTILMMTKGLDDGGYTLMSYFTNEIKGDEKIRSWIRSSQRVIHFSSRFRNAVQISLMRESLQIIYKGRITVGYGYYCHKGISY